MNAHKPLLQRLVVPGGGTLVVMDEADCHDLRDAADLAKSKAAFARGEEEWLSEDEVRRSLAMHPLAFWREKRGLTQKALGEKVGDGESYVAGLEAGRNKGDPALFKRLAAALGVRMEDVVGD